MLVGLFVSRPLFERKAIPVRPVDQQLSSLLAERDRVINALQELDFDHSLGKIPSDDYPEQRAALVQRGADLLRQLDVYNPEAADEDADARIEAVLVARRASQQAVPARKDLSRQEAESDEQLEVLIATRRRQRQDKSAGFCPQCGRAVQKSDRFCPKCGASLG
jgi:rubrerythrin